MTANPFKKKVDIPEKKIEVKKEEIIEIDESGKVGESFLEEITREKSTETPKGKILKQFNMIESNIPINHPYWKMR